MNTTYWNSRTSMAAVNLNELTSFFDYKKLPTGLIQYQESTTPEQFDPQNLHHNAFFSLDPQEFNGRNWKVAFEMDGLRGSGKLSIYIGDGTLKQFQATLNGANAINILSGPDRFSVGDIDRVVSGSGVQNQTIITGVSNQIGSTGKYTTASTNQDVDTISSPGTALKLGNWLAAEEYQSSENNNNYNRNANVVSGTINYGHNYPMLGGTLERYYISGTENIRAGVLQPGKSYTFIMTYRSDNPIEFVSSHNSRTCFYIEDLGEQTVAS